VYLGASDPRGLAHLYVPGPGLVLSGTTLPSVYTFN